MEAAIIKTEHKEQELAGHSCNTSQDDLITFIKCEQYQITGTAVNSDGSMKPEDHGCKKSYQTKKRQDTARCDVCNKTFISTKTLMIHQDRIHKILPDDQQPICNQCERTFPNQTKLKTHQEIHKLVECTICKKNVMQKCLKEHMAAHGGAFRCELCAKEFSTCRSLKLHKQLTHAPNPPTQSSEVQRFQCNQCERVFLNEAQLNFHVRGHQRQQCPVCGKIFLKSSMKQHIASHGGAYRCDICDSTFCSKQRLRSHNAVKHASDGSPGPSDGTYGCPLCSLAFASEKQLDVHSRSHMKKQCPMCRKKISPKNMPAHLAVHAYRS